MSIDNTTSVHRNMGVDGVDELLKGGMMIRSIRITEGQGGRYYDLRFTVVTEPGSVRDSKLEGLVSRGISRVTAGITSLRIGRSERDLIRQLSDDIITGTTSRLLSFVLDGDLDYLDSNMISSGSEDMVDEVIDKIIIGLNAGDTFSELCESLSDYAAYEIIYANYGENGESQMGWWLR